MDTTTTLYAQIDAYITRTEAAVTAAKLRLADAVLEGDDPKCSFICRELAEMFDTLAALHRILAS